VPVYLLDNANILMKFILWLLSFVLISCSNPVDEKVIKIYNWSNYIDPRILHNFTAETGIKVIYDVYDSNDVLETKLLAGHSHYDIVVPSADFLSRQIRAGVYQKLDKSKLSNLGNLWDFVSQRTAAYDPNNAYSINYMWGTVGIGYNVAKIKQRLPNLPLDSWQLFFNPQILAKLADCGVQVIDSANEIIPIALSYLGENPDSKNPAVIAKAEAVLMAIRPFIQKFNSSEYMNALANDDICLAVGYSGDVLQAKSRAIEGGSEVNIAYLVPKEGSLIWADQMAIPADAPHPDYAHLFLNYLMRPKVIAQASEYVSYANGNQAAQAFMSPAIKNNPLIYPSAATMAKLYTISPYEMSVQRVLTRIWTRVVTGQ
jgi:putrescine transport system substrate-binding protein